MAKGMVLAFGPVADPKGAYGIAVAQLENGADTLPLADNEVGTRWLANRSKAPGFAS